MSWPDVKEIFDQLDREIVRRFEREDKIIGWMMDRNMYCQDYFKMGFNHEPFTGVDFNFDNQDSSSGTSEISFLTFDYDGEPEWVTIDN